ncbi:uncharacterized protein C20orf204 homolog [Tympanuchus pallidicinctus]|uniref:uncharacterized protein C20orf204 homolog n=1 Tax=Tympanuchus pallidicinctus TaxID=109042 RepID=UPI0022872752|nr:uncharacterized protein C20orf204 homolog [Tympanuchus pallidicinctus]
MELGAGLAGRAWSWRGGPVRPGLGCGLDLAGLDVGLVLRGAPSERMGRGPRGLELLPRALSCAVLLLLLATVLGRGWRCSIARILRQYRAVIFHEIQNLKNLSGSAEKSSRAGPVCRSDKDQRILQSIYNISMSLRDVAGGALRGPEEAAVWKVVRDTEFVLRENCRRIGKSPPRPPLQPHRRRQQLKEISRKAQRLATCWEKLNVLHAAPRDS